MSLSLCCFVACFCILCKSLQLLCILPFGMLCLSAISMMGFLNSGGSVYVSGDSGLSESGLCVFRELCPVSFLVVGESWPVFCSHVVC